MLTVDEHLNEHAKKKRHADAILLYVVGIYGCKQESVNICCHAHIYLTKITYHSQAISV